MAELKETYACIPSTERGRGILISGDPKSNSILYCNGRSVIIRYLDRPLQVSVYGEHAYQATVARYSPNGEWIASADVSGTVRIWGTHNDFVLKKEFRVLSGRIDDLQWSPDGMRIVASGDGKGKSLVRAFMWDSGTNVGEFDGHSRRVLSCAFKPTRPFRIATCGEDFLMNFYEGPPFKFKLSHREHSNFVNCVRFSPDGSKLISVSSDKKGIVYDAKTGDIIGGLSSEDGHQGSIYAFSWSPDSKQIEPKNVKRLCHTKRLLTINGKYPGPTIFVHEGDIMEVKVTNRSPWNTTLHWHGVRQLRSGWADGPAYITQCPIVPGSTYTYKFTIINQRGTLWWHAHIAWQRATVYGAFIIYPRMPYPFSAPVEAEFPIVFGEWWNEEVEDIEHDMKLYGSGPNSSDAYTINGLPGPLYPCSNKDTFIKTVERGKTYLLRIINAALNEELFFAVANHTLTVVEIDAAYTKPFTTKAIMIAPGQTTNVLLTANQVPDSTGMFVMAARPYLTSVFPFDNSTTIGFLRYKIQNAKITKTPVTCHTLPSNLPQMKDTPFATSFAKKLRSLGSPEYPCNVPKKIDKRVITTISLNLQDCPANQTCKGFHNKKYYASMNNQSFVRPSMSILECHYRNLSTTLFSSFPERPPHPFNYTGVDPLSENMNTEFGTRLLVVPYGTRLEIVLQDTSFLNQENHPIHIHGHNFFIVGRGFGNYDVARDPAGYNLIDPPERNTVAVPVGGWAALRLTADNPGVWFIHCHEEEHTSWGLAMGLIVQSGQHPSQCLLPPPHDFPRC